MIFIRSTSQELHAAIERLRPQNVERRFKELQQKHHGRNSKVLTSPIRFCSPSTPMRVSDADRGEVVSVKLSRSTAAKTVRFEGGSAEDWLRFFSNTLQIVENKNLYEIAMEEGELHNKKSAQALELSERPEKTGQELTKNESENLKSLIEEAKEHRKKEKEALDEVVNTIKVRLPVSISYKCDKFRFTDFRELVFEKNVLYAPS